MAKANKGQQPAIENRRARHDYVIGDTLEVGIVLVGPEVKSVRDGRVSLAEGYARVEEGGLFLHGVTIAEYPPAGALQHAPARRRRLLAHGREIRKLAKELEPQGVTLVPLKMYFKNGRAKLLIGVARGRGKADKRDRIAEREARRDIERAMSKRR